MAANPIQKPRCSTCPHRFTYLESISRREGGVNLQFGREYCKGGKKYRAFKKSDPKTYPPDWCPKRKDLCEFRIYTFKDTDTWYLHYRHSLYVPFWWCGEMDAFSSSLRWLSLPFSGEVKQQLNSHFI